MISSFNKLPVKSQCFAILVLLLCDVQKVPLNEFGMTYNYAIP
jgi:hypothetical protein